MAASIEIAAACGVVAALYPPDDRLPDAGSLAYLRNGETSLATFVCQGVTDAHAVPPLLFPLRAARGAVTAAGFSSRDPQ
jgi:hypothetical protein